MGKGSNLGVSVVENQEENNLPTYTWEEIKGGQNWIVMNGFVYDVNNFMKKHPGGPRIIKNHVGEDASVN